MPAKPAMADLIRQHKTLFLILAVIALLVEVEIFAVAVMKSGRSSLLQVRDNSGAVIHESDGNNLSSFDKYYFEQTFGPLENYEVQLVTRTRPFPFRAWLAAAVGLPVGAILLFAFIVKAYMSIFYPDHSSAPAAAPPADGPPESGQVPPEPMGRWERILARTSRFNVFILGFIIVLAAFLYWVVPNMLAYLGRVGLDTVVNYKWLFLGLGGVLSALVAWVIFLRYKLASQSIQAQADLDRYRLQLELAPESAERLQIAHQGDGDSFASTDTDPAANPAPDQAPPSPGTNTETPSVD